MATRRVAACTVILVLLLSLCLSCHRRAQRDYKAHADITMLVSAVKWFRGEYGRFPVAAELAWRTHGGRKAVIYNDDPVGPRGAGKAQAVQPQHAPMREPISSPLLLDRWGNPYRVMFDTAGEGYVQVGNTRISDIVAVWSVGRNGQDELGSGDDVCSWR